MKVKLGDVCEIIRNGASIKQHENTGGIPITRIETISEKIFNRNKLGYAGINSVEEYKDYILRNDDILMSHINSEKHLGKVAIYNQINNEHIIHGMNLLMLRIKKEIFLPKYAIYYFETPLFLQQIKRITKHSVNQASFTVSELKKIYINLPPLDEQRHIAAVLDKVSDLIALRKKQLAKLDELVKARFVEMFGDPVSNSLNMPLLSLSQLGEFGRGVSKYRPRNAPELLGGKYPLIQTGEVANSGLYISSYKNTYSELGFQQSKMWKSGTLCITIAANIARTAILSFDACFPDSVVGFISNSKTNNIFVHYWFDFFQQILEAQAPESAQKNINLKILSELKVIVPERKLQNKFAKFVEKVENQKKIIQQSFEKLEILKKSLMQEYFG